MARKKNAAKAGSAAVNLARTKLHKSAGDAVEILTGQLDVFAQKSIEALRLWEEQRQDLDADDPNYYFDAARDLAQECARLGEAIAAIKGESHNHLQHIRVERLAKPGANVVTREIEAHAKLLEAKAESGQAPENRGEGGTPQ